MMTSLSGWGQTHVWFHGRQTNVELHQDNSGAHSFQEFPLMERNLRKAYLQQKPVGAKEKKIRQFSGETLNT